MATALSNAPDVTAESYVVLGLAVCFVREDTDIHQVRIVEPIPSSALEALLKGVPTSYEFVYATTIGDLFEGESLKIPAEFPAEVQLGNDLIERTIASARTYRKRPEATQHISVGTVYRELNHSTERKRVLGGDRVVTAEDNVKQHQYTHEVL